MDAYWFTPSDGTAATIEAFIGECRVNSDIAAGHLAQGYFEPCLRTAGRPDLQQFAAYARTSGVDKVAALEQFLEDAGRALSSHPGAGHQLALRSSS